MTQGDDLFDYSRCTIAELEDVASHIDRERFPERLAEVQRLLAIRRSEPQPEPLGARTDAELSVGKLLSESGQFLQNR